MRLAIAFAIASEFCHKRPFASSTARTEILPFVGNIPVTTTTKIFPKVLRYKWEPYCNTNGRRTAIQMGGVLTLFPFLRA